MCGQGLTKAGGLPGARTATYSYPAMTLPLPRVPDAARGAVEAARRGTPGPGVPRTALRVLRSLADPAVVAGAAVEAVWVGAHLATWPLGLVDPSGAPEAPGYRLEHLPPVQRGMLVSDVEAAGTPILLVHGLVSNRSIFTVLRRGLTRRGFSNVFAMNYATLATDVRTAALRLAEEVEGVCAETGFERIHVIGHSLGGLIARYYVTRLGGDERVHTLVTLGTPHEGTWAAYSLPTRLMRQMRPGSGLMRELARPVRGCRTRFLAYWSDSDLAIVPQRSAALSHPDLSTRTVRLHGAGHLTLPMLGDVVHGISAALTQLDVDGSTLRHGVTPLSRRD